MLDAVYVDTVEEKSVVALKPKPAFRALFQIATTKEGSGVVLYKENPPDLFISPEDDSPCLWWRRGRVGCSLFETNFGGQIARHIVDTPSIIPLSTGTRLPTLGSIFLT